MAKMFEYKEVFFVVKSVRTWAYNEDLKMFVWIEKSHEDLTEYRTTKDDANKDFENLGFSINPNALVQCKDFIIHEKKWIRYIVQCRTIKEEFETI